MAGSPGRARKTLDEKYNLPSGPDDYERHDVDIDLYVPTSHKRGLATPSDQFKELARSTPAGFAMYCSKGEWEIARHLALFNELMLKVAAREIRHLIISCPPRHGKSQFFSRYGPPWIVGALGEKVILTSYEARFAASWGAYGRDIISEFGPELFDIKLNPSHVHAEHWETTHGGIMYTSGVGGPLTGKGCDWLIIDDPVKNREESMSATIRENTLDWYRSTAYSRVEAGGVVILMMTRWHEEDLAGVLAAEEPDLWTVINLPAIAEENDPLGRAEGEALWPELWPVPELMLKKRTAQDYWWSALYQQRPTVRGGNKIQSDWWKFYDEHELPAHERLVITWDTASTVKKNSAYSVAAVWQQSRNGFHVIELKRDRVEFPELLKWALDLGERYPNALHLVEDASTGIPLQQMLRSETRLPVKAVKVHVDKVARLNEVIHVIEGGRVHLPKHAPWLHDFLEEHRRFPATTYKDQVDSTTLALKHFIGGGTRFDSKYEAVGHAHKDNDFLDYEQKLTTNFREF